MELIDNIIGNWDNLSLDDKEYTFEILHKNIIQTKRDLLIQRVNEAKINYNSGLYRSGSVDDLFMELEND